MSEPETPPDGWNDSGDYDPENWSKQPKAESRQRVFSWDTTEGHLFEVVREPKSDNVSRDGYEWECAGTIARFRGAVAEDLLALSIQALKNRGWAWVVPPESILPRETSRPSAGRLACRESNFLRHTPSEPLAATPAEAFSGERSEP